jgi:predicted membrane-bound mannosyltransferase
MIKNIERFKFNIFNLFSLTIIGLFLTYILSLFLDLFSIEEISFQIQIAVFGILLIILALLASYNVIWKTNVANLFLMMCASCVLISDVFYLVFNYQNQLQVLDCIHFSCQLFSYFFFIKYILLRKSNTSISS